MQRMRCVLFKPVLCLLALCATIVFGTACSRGAHADVTEMPSCDGDSAATVATDSVGGDIGDADMRRQSVVMKFAEPCPMGTDCGDNDTDDYGDQYDNPDFDDLTPGEEFDEEFIGNEGDAELYEG